MKIPKTAIALKTTVLAAAIALSPAAAPSMAATAVQLPSGQYITPTIVPGAVQQFLNPGLAAYPNFVAGEAVRAQLSPDGQTLAVLTAGQNSLYNTAGAVDVAASTQFLFLYDVSGSNKTHPLLKQVIQQKNAHVGLVFAPNGQTLYAAGGRDDAVYAYTQQGGSWVLAHTIALGHLTTAGLGGIGLSVSPNASGLAVSADGKTLVVVNNYNDSISVIDTATATVRYEHDLRPYFSGNEGTPGAAGGTFPFAVVLKGTTAYVSSDRDRQVVVVDISSATAGKLVQRIALDGNALGMTLDATGHKLYVAQDNADQVAVIGTSTNTIVDRIDARAPAGLLAAEHEGEHRDQHASHHYTGAATFAVRLSSNGKTLYAVNAGANAIAVIPLTGEHAHEVRGLIPTAYEPHDIAFSSDGSWMYIINGKSVTGPNPGYTYGNTAALKQLSGNTLGNPALTTTAEIAAAGRANNQYQFQLEHASLVSAPVPSEALLPALTAKVAQNNFYGVATSEQDQEVVEFLRHHIKHVIYIVKENRTFDQILGDLNNGSNGQPGLTLFGAAITPNFHRIANQFVTLDNFRDPGDGSMDGWSWALQGRVTNTETITQQINYAAVNRGLSYESEGSNRNVPVNLPTVAQRDAVAGPTGTANYTAATAGVSGGTVNLLAGGGNHASTDAPFGIQHGYIFDAALQAGGTVRNYGFLVNNYGSIGTIAAPVSDPFAAGIVQVGPLDLSLNPLTDVYFRGYDQNYPDLWRFNEWKREFDGFVANGNLPNLSLVRFSHDHTGSFATALGGVNFPEAQEADNDLAVGRLVEAVAHSPYMADTLILVTEDDCQDGADHVDSHRATAYLVGPYVKQGAVVSTRYSQVNALRTIEDILGTPHINLNTAFQTPMTDAFDIHGNGTWTYAADASTVLKQTTLSLAANGLGVPYAMGPDVKPRHSATWWAKATKGFNFEEADQVPVAAFNRVLWKGMKGNKPYPGPTARVTAEREND